jgi:hypothetical protein
MFGGSSSWKKYKCHKKIKSPTDDLRNKIARQYLTMFRQKLGKILKEKSLIAKVTFVDKIYDLL